MNLRILLPTEIFLDRVVAKVVAETGDGFYGLLPRHVDFTAALVPGILTYADDDGNEEFLAIDEGVLVKHGQDVFISTRNAIRGPDLEKLQEAVTEQFRNIGERERKARTVLSRLEADIIRRFLEM
ncbi:MAG: F0F1 ATP synthase subunit epsilon [Candidatus Latescibacterota bacterium]